ncbi:hypothetical protein [Bradyrhizobium sp. LCT2]|uniref:hypothetical protein n=1 Tax=Bradyrhizobium sp. LCT2 TaxID=2493093 RepID=UPI00352FA253
MAGAIELIVEGYVSLRDQAALDELRTQRRKLIADLNACTGIDCTSTIRQIEEDIVVIEAGLAMVSRTPPRRESSEEPANPALPTPPAAGLINGASNE